MGDIIFFEGLLDECGAVGYVIIGLFLLSSLLFFRRFILLHRAKIDSEGFLLGIKNNLKGSNGRKFIEAIAICDETRGPVASVTRSILSRDCSDETALRRAAEEAATVEVPRLQKDSRMISAIGQLLPLLGLLGTVLALRGFFGDDIARLGVEKVSVNIRTALVNTAMGLAGGIIVHLYSVILHENCQNIVHDMEKTAVELINFLVEPSDLAERMNSRLLSNEAEGAGK